MVGSKSSITIPTITPDDLLAFHFKHFNSHPPHISLAERQSELAGNQVSLNSSSDQEPEKPENPEESEEHGEHGESKMTKVHHDGTPCTLTEQEIMFFRMQEVHKNEFLKENSQRKKNLRKAKRKARVKEDEDQTKKRRLDKDL